MTEPKKENFRSDGFLSALGKKLYPDFWVITRIYPVIVKVNYMKLIKTHGDGDGKHIAKEIF